MSGTADIVPDPESEPGIRSAGGLPLHGKVCDSSRRCGSLAVGPPECQCRRVVQPSGPTGRGSACGGSVPTYQYACTECDHTFEQFQSFHDDSLTVLPGVCGSAPQGLQRCGRRVQGIRLLPHRQPGRRGHRGRRQQQRLLGLLIGDEVRGHRRPRPRPRRARSGDDLRHPRPPPRATPAPPDEGVGLRSLRSTGAVDSPRRIDAWLPSLGGCPRRRHDFGTARLAASCDAPSWPGDVRSPPSSSGCPWWWPSAPHRATSRDGGGAHRGARHRPGRRRARPGPDPGPVLPRARPERCDRL